MHCSHPATNQVLRTRKSPWLVRSMHSTLTGSWRSSGPTTAGHFVDLISSILSAMRLGASYWVYWYHRWECTVYNLFGLRDSNCKMHLKNVSTLVWTLDARCGGGEEQLHPVPVGDAVLVPGHRSRINARGNVDHHQHRHRFKVVFRACTGCSPLYQWCVGGLEQNFMSEALPDTTHLLLPLTARCWSVIMVTLF